MSGFFSSAVLSPKLPDLYPLILWQEQSIAFHNIISLVEIFHVWEYAIDPIDIGRMGIGFDNYLK